MADPAPKRNDFDSTTAVGAAYPRTSSLINSIVACVVLLQACCMESVSTLETTDPRTMEIILGVYGALRVPSLIDRTIFSEYT